MSALVLSAAEQRVYRALIELADRLDLQVSHRQVQSMARVAARAAREPRPRDGEPRGVTGGRKAAQRPPAARKGRSAGSETQAASVAFQEPSGTFGGAA